MNKKSKNRSIKKLCFLALKVDSRRNLERFATLISLHFQKNITNATKLPSHHLRVLVYKVPATAVFKQCMVKSIRERLHANIHKLSRDILHFYGPPLLGKKKNT